MKSKLGRLLIAMFLMTIMFFTAGAFAGQAASSGIMLQWQDNSDNETWTIVWRKRIPGPPHWYGIGMVPTNIVTYLDDDVRPGREYCYIVTASNDAGESPDSNQACAIAP